MEGEPSQGPGVSDPTPAKDTDLTMALCRHGWRVVYEERATAWTEAAGLPSAPWWQQRFRWCHSTVSGHVQAPGGPGAGRLVRQTGSPRHDRYPSRPRSCSSARPGGRRVRAYGPICLDPLVIAALWLGLLLLQIAIGLYAFRL